MSNLPGTNFYDVSDAVSTSIGNSDYAFTFNGFGSYDLKRTDLPQ